MRGFDIFFPANLGKLLKNRFETPRFSSDVTFVKLLILDLAQSPSVLRAMMCRHPLYQYVYSRERCSFKAKYSNIIDNSMCAFILVHPSHKCDLCCYDGWVRRRIHYISLVPRVRNRIHLYIQRGRNNKHGIMCAELLTVSGAFANTGLSTCRIMPSIPSCVCFINRGNLSYLVLTLFVVSCYRETNICVYIWMLWLPQSKPEIWIYIGVSSQKAKFMGSIWGPSGSCWPQIGPILAPWALLSGLLLASFIMEISLLPIVYCKTSRLLMT